jgi:Domain of unknown function (DUF1864)
VQMNAGPENLYFSQENRSRVTGLGDAPKAALRDKGRTYVAARFAEGNTGDAFDSAFGVLGNVGPYFWGVAAARTQQSGAREALAVSRSVIACLARRRLLGDGSEIFRQPSGYAPQGARRRKQEFHLAALRSPA